MESKLAENYGVISPPPAGQMKGEQKGWKGKVELNWENVTALSRVEVPSAQRFRLQEFLQRRNVVLVVIVAVMVVHDSGDGGLVTTTCEEKGN
jgi:hypothetical protein